MTRRGDRDRQRIEQVAAILRREPGADKYRIVAQLRADGIVLDPSSLNKLLYRDPRFVADKSTDLPTWSLADRPAATPKVSRRPAVAPVLGNRFLKPLPRAARLWQQEALGTWKASGRMGVVEAVTGTGKTFLGVMAAREQLERGGKVVVLVPGKTLASQWSKALSEIIHEQRIGLLGSGHTDSLRSHDILIATVQSGFRRELLPRDVDGLLVADECHNYGANKYRLALEQGFSARLGLTATFERSDDGVDMVLKPFFHRVVFRIGYERAISEGVVAHFRVALVGVRFTTEENDRYKELGTRLRKSVDWLIGVRKFPNVWKDPGKWGIFLQRAERLSNSGELGSDFARKFLTAFSQRRKLLAETSAKSDAISDLAEAVRKSSRAIVFTQTKAAAVQAATMLSAHGVSAHSLCAGFEDAQRDTVLAEFGGGRVRALVAPRLLDEGVDVPEADLAVVLAASRSRRQMIQRMGRVLRPKADGRAARFAVLYVVGTSEDPELGAHESFLEEALENADEHQMFVGPNAAKDAVGYLLPVRRDS